MANYYYKIRKLKNAIEIYKLLLKKEPSNIDLYLKLGAIYLKEGNKKQAESAWQTALKYDPGSKIIKANLKNIDNYAK
jgi:Flp pilus assembly protein TadD